MVICWTHSDWPSRSLHALSSLSPCCAWGRTFGEKSHLSVSSTCFFVKSSSSKIKHVLWWLIKFSYFLTFWCAPLAPRDDQSAKLPLWRMTNWNSSLCALISLMCCSRSEACLIAASRSESVFSCSEDRMSLALFISSTDDCSCLRKLRFIRWFFLEETKKEAFISWWSFQKPFLKKQST